MAIYRSINDALNAGGGSGSSIIARVTANNTSNQGFLPASAFAIWQGWTEHEDLGSQFNATTGLFTAAANGTYTIIGGCDLNSGGTLGPYYLGVALNGTLVNVDEVIWTDAATVGWQGHLDAGDTLELQIAGASGGASANAERNYVSILGFSD